MKTLRRFAASTGLAWSLLLCLADFARAANLSWINAAGGAAGVAANWNPVQVPAAADWLTFALNATYSVTFGAAVPASDELLVQDGIVTFRFPTAHTNSTVFGLPGIGTDAEATIESGSLTLQRNLYVGQTAGHDGTLTVTGAGTSLTATGATGVTSFGDQGTGTFNVLDGATVTVANSPEFGDRAGGLGTLVVGGVSGTERAELIVNNTTTDPMEFGSNGTGNGGVLVGGRMSVDGTVHLGKNPGGNGTFSVAGVSGTDSATAQVGGDLMIARNDVNGTAAGTGTWVVGSGGITDVAGTTYTFDPDGSTGKLQVLTGGRFETGSLVANAPATQLDLRGGTTQVRGGTLDLGGQPLVVSSAVGSPVLELLDGAQASLGSASGPTLTVGRGAAGTLRVLAGSDLSVHDFNMFVGDSASGDGTLEVNHAGSSLTVDNTLIVGRSGDGTLDIAGGSDATIGSLRMGTQAGGNGHGTIRGTGTQVHVSDYLELAGTPGGGVAGATAQLGMSDHSELWLDRPGDSGHVWGGGYLEANSTAVVHISGTLQNYGRVAVVQPGTYTGGVIRMNTDSRLLGRGTITSAILADTDTTGRIQPSGDLTLGNPASPTGFHFLGSIDLPTGLSATLVDADSAVVGTVNLAGGTLTGPATGVHLAANHRIAGTGTVDANLRVAGSLIPTGATGLTLKRAVFGAGQGINGTRIAFAPGSSFIGNGAIAATVQVDSGAVLLPNGNLTLGNAPLASSVTVDGAAVVGPLAGLTFAGTDSTRVKGTITLLGANVTSLNSSPILLQPAGRLGGRGNAFGRTISRGTVEPGGNTAGALGFASLVMQAGSHLVFDVGNWTVGQLDTVSSANPMTIAGTLDVRGLPGFVSVAGDSFQVLSYASRSGAFSDVTFDGNPAAGQLQVVYHPTSAWVKMLVNALDAPPGGLAGRGELRFGSVGSPARSLRFALELPAAADVTVELFDVGGRRLGTLHEGALAAGRHVFDGERAAANAGGLYFARATVRGTAGATVRTTRAVRLP